ncbi:acyltransferase domain-containing protein, partial [Frankia sp. AgPm24]|uniref:type I polyketide synthase n=1 Tax=Frankia sp. AgPm24 TaxID=631128 RepID=UPI00200BDFB3
MSIEHPTSTPRPPSESTVPDRTVTDRTVTDRSVADRSVADEAVAVIGLACRLPGAASPEAFWRLLVDEVEAVGDIPAARVAPAGPLPARASGGWPLRGGFLAEVDTFDADFFGISAREAASLDPQQRLALELAWEVLEDTRSQPPAAPVGPVGVYLGAIADDYARLALGQGEAAVGPHTLTGQSRGLLANRVSYLLGLSGPSLVVDSGQSSSLVAVHLACESIRRGESRLALAGGIDLHLDATGFRTAEKFGALSPTGRCHTFDARADGYVRGEGGGLVALKALRDAIADGDRIHAVIRGSAVNNDAGGQGLTVPRQGAQEEVLHAAYARAAVAPSAARFVELHGTGTPVGDPIEAAALGAVLGRDRGQDEPLLVGSVKTNIGHLEGAAGIAGLLKAVLSVAAGTLPASLHFESPNPRIPLDELNLRVNVRTQPIRTAGRPLIAGVSSFGMGGTNCHLVLGEAPPSTAPTSGATEAGSDALVFTLSGRSRQALRGQAARLHEHLAAHPDAGLADVAYSLAATRRTFEHRAAIVTADRDTLRTELAALAEGRTIAGFGPPLAGADRPVLVFPGQGSQWVGMTRQLRARSDRFRAAWDRCLEALAPYLDWSPDEAIDDPRLLERSDVVQPLLWAAMISLARLWESYGVIPAAVVGHSQGEIAAAHLAGVLSLADSAKVVALRGKALTTLVGLGGMATLGLPAADATEYVARWDGQLTLAAVNGPRSCVVAGPPDALQALIARAQADGIFVRLVPIAYPSHSRFVEPVREPMLAALADITAQPAQVPFYSTVTGDLIADTTTLTADYWYTNLRQAVRFHDAVGALARDGHRLFIESSTHPVLTVAVQDTLDDAGVDGRAFATLRRNDGDLTRWHGAVGDAFAAGLTVDWQPAFAGHPVRPVDLPTYAFQRRRHWLDAAVPTNAASAPPGTAPASTPAASTAATVDADRGPVADPPADDSLAAQVAALPRGDRHAHLLRLVRAEVEAVLGGGEATDLTRTFKDLGLDSHLSVELRNRLAAVTGQRLPAGILFDHPTADRLVGHLLERLVGADATVATGAASGRTGGPADSREPIAVVGMACRLPGGITSPDELWHL